MSWPQPSDIVEKARAVLSFVIKRAPIAASAAVNITRAAPNAKPALDKVASLASIVALADESMKAASGTYGGGKGGAEHGSGGNGRDRGPVDYSDKTAALDELKEKASCIRKGYNKRIYYKLDSFWYSKDTAEHGGAVFKCYKDTRSNMEFVGSTDEKLQLIEEKHESMKGTSIKKKDTKIIKGDIKTC